MVDQTITKVAIHPAIGIARVGNSTEYFMASEIPGQPPQPDGGFKDAQGKVKKQAVRFRIYGLNDAGEIVKELKGSDGAKIDWHVHIANRKAAWYQFSNALDLEGGINQQGLSIPAKFRNLQFPQGQRDQLVIDAGKQTISGIHAARVSLMGAFPEAAYPNHFVQKPVPLGHLLTDEQGRLMFFGGDGRSASYDNTPAATFANNDKWHDDVSDGPVHATVTYQGKTMEAIPAHVVVTPPNFGPGLYAMTTMYDVVRDMYIREGVLPEVSAINFWEDVYPILERMSQTQWVNEGFNVLFGKNSPSDPTAPELLEKLSNPAKEHEPIRTRWFEMFRDPESHDANPVQFPPFYGDTFSEFTDRPNAELAVTQTQYKILKMWAKGEFPHYGEPAKPQSFNELSPKAQTESLDIAGLDECMGGPFHPGIEMSWPMRHLIMWEPGMPYRLKTSETTQDDFGPYLAPATVLADGGPLDGSGPGSITRWTGVPWQTDEASCRSGYDVDTYLPLPSFWAARVPNQVLSEKSLERIKDTQLNIAQRLKHFDYRQDWLRILGSDYTEVINNMVNHWDKMGIIAEHNVPEDLGTEFLPEKLWLETQTGSIDHEGPVEDTTFEQVLWAENAQQPKNLYSSAKKSGAPTPDKTAAPKKPRKPRVLQRNQRFR